MSDPVLRPQPRPHQEADAAALIQHLRDAAQTPRAQYLAACGTGKTFTSLWVAEGVAEHRVIVAQPSLALIDQAARAWSRAAHRPLAQLALCSAQEVAAETADGHAVRIPTATDLATVAPFWRAHPVSDDGLQVLWVCFASTDRLVDLLADAQMPSADLLVVDEAHLVAGPPKMVQQLLDATRVRATRRLFQTATPIEAPSEATADDLEPGAPLDAADVPDETSLPTASIGMEREDLFGPVVAERTFGWAIDEGLLTPYRLRTPAPLPSHAAARLAALPVPPGRDADFWAKVFVITRTALEDGGARLLTFHRTVASAKSYAAAIGQVAQDFFQQPLFTDTISGDDPIATRTARLNQLASATAGVITSAKALSVGIDVPALDGVVFVEPRRSVPDVAQIVGRAVRRDPARPQKMAQILVPIVVTPVPPAEAQTAGADDRAAPGPIPSATGTGARTAASGPLVADRDWQALNEVVEALAEHDSRLRGALRAIRAGGDPAAAESADGADPTALFDAAAIRVEFAHWSEADRAALTRQLTYQLAVRHARRRADYWAALDNYATTHGTIAMPVSMRWQGLPLGGFLSRLRREGRDGQLAPADAQRLNAYTGWSLDPARDAWIADAERVKAWMAAHGGVHPQYPATDADEALVGIWVKNVRAERKPTTKRGRLAAWQEVWLEANIPTWAWEEKDAPVRRRAPSVASPVARTGTRQRWADQHKAAAAPPPPKPLPAEWLAQADALAAHLADHGGAWPRLGGQPVPSVPERLLNLWLTEQEEDAAAGRLDPRAAERLTDVLTAAVPPHPLALALSPAAPIPMTPASPDLRAPSGPSGRHA